MLLVDENNQQINIDSIKTDLKNYTQLPTPSQQEVENSLGAYYHQALQLEAGKYSFEVALAPNAMMDLPGIGKKILEAVRKFVCGFLTGSSTIDQIINAVLTALASIIPGGIIVKTVANCL
jgi:hypothetical protein